MSLEMASDFSNYLFQEDIREEQVDKAEDDEENGIIFSDYDSESECFKSTLSKWVEIASKKINKKAVSSENFSHFLIGVQKTP